MLTEIYIEALGGIFAVPISREGHTPAMPTDH